MVLSPVAEDPIGFAKRLEERFGNPPPELAQLEWRFYEVTDPYEIAKISRKREEEYGANSIDDETDGIFSWDYSARHLALAFRKPGEDWTLSKSLKVITRSTQGVLPTELGMNCDFVRAKDSEYPEMSLKDAQRFKELLDKHDPDKTIEIGGIVSHSDVCSMGCLYRLFGCMSLFYDSLGSDSLIIQSSNPSHARLYLKGSGVNYQLLAGDPMNPYRDHNGRPAVAIYLDPSSFRNSFYPMMNESDFVQNILLSTYDLDGKRQGPATSKKELILPDSERKSKTPLLESIVRPSFFFLGHPLTI